MLSDFSLIYLKHYLKLKKKEKKVMNISNKSIKVDWQGSLK